MADLDAILDAPALPPPPGVTSNFDNPERYNTSGYALCSLFLALGTIAIGLRVYSRVVRTGKIRLEDFLGIAGFILFAAYIVAVLLVVGRPGFYVHQWDIRVRDMSRILYIFYLSSNFYNGAIGCLKVAILLEWLHVFNPLSLRNAFFWTCQVVLWINILYYAGSAFAINLICQPHRKIWDKTITEGYCGDSNILYLSGTIVNLISDVLILGLPQGVIWSLKMTTPRRIGISVIFAIGVLCCIVACFRIASTVELPTIADFIFVLPKLAFWGSAEMLLVLLVFCVPAFPNAFKGLGLMRDDTTNVSSHKGSSLDSRKQMWTRTYASARPQSDYQKISDYNLVPVGNSMPPEVAATASSSEVHSDQEPHAITIPEGGIVWTREFSAREEFIPPPPTHDGKRQNV
ncbi:hypothetical protein GGS23DRAFT_94123 [Durotheca rogersii]|uniref:uncharacterized protein n=1 Tax=Durotheca rogersii TaxID=419775 RepID=UPI0022202C61|nr:uncharacterized protein GGS23DRAFT_94123 [Durotheca rogersii]KAI5862343.1 hypothetical protein GGS23DRAFT_94123 [Durotheca rogersii]